jgi:GNAT superfamily N-acetyltransferase
MNIAIEKNGYMVSTDKSKLDLNVIYRYLSVDSYWARNIPLAVVQTSIEHSLCFGMYHEAKQVGFARLITDQATFAYLADVFILPEQQGKGLGKWFMQVIHGIPELQHLRAWLLRTRDAHGLYMKFGYEPVSQEQLKRMMHKRNEHPYPTNNDEKKGV